MSKIKMTIEDLLGEVLVPEKEQPYEVPKNWIWLKLKGIGNVKGGKRLPKGHVLLQEPTQYPYLRVADFRNGAIDNKDLKYISEETARQISRYIICKDDVYISIAGTIGKTGIVPNYLSGSNLTENAAKITDIKGTSNEFIHLVLNTDELQNQIKNSTVSTSQPKLALFRIEDLKIPLPPINEQKRITEKVENLVNKIEEAKQLIKEVQETFELRRAAILDNAFRGELTRQWRENRGLNEGSNEEFVDSFFSLPNNWKWVKLSDILQMQNGMSKRRGTNGTSIPVLRLADIKGNEFVASDLREIMLSDKEFEKYGLEKDDILFIRVNGSFNLVGKVIHFNLSREAAYCDHLIRGTFDKEQINVLYIKNLFDSHIIRNQIINKIVSSAGQNTISQGSLGSIIIPLPPKEEMDAIADVIEKAISKEETVLAHLDNNTHIELLKQSILSKAFRGELGTNDPSEESAIELLKEALQEQVK
ncbi:restriction endonuclease subunit S [Bacillus sp. AFS031507]|uniref:restriction endonuclease subunit S n=1 Tax=Bacillus sp. AFS031507 TaxID=2033496 RepID=UPI000BFD4B3B|nr:restriction endonuclease subunit S [Bacillus sp. AFS031507]PGY11127.1 hypothetical protein COE25_11440 [Bacillus sp. AFS031507]